MKEDIDYMIFANHEIFNVKVGDTVKIVRKIYSNTYGWNNVWTNSMDNFIGSVFKVRQVFKSNNEVRLYGSPYRFPIFALEKVEP